MMNVIHQLYSICIGRKAFLVYLFSRLVPLVDLLSIPMTTCPIVVLKGKHVFERSLKPRNKLSFYSLIPEPQGHLETLWHFIKECFISIFITRKTYIWGGFIKSLSLFRGIIKFTSLSEYCSVKFLYNTFLSDKIWALLLLILSSFFFSLSVFIYLTF